MKDNDKIVCTSFIQKQYTNFKICELCDKPESAHFSFDPIIYSEFGDLIQSKMEEAVQLMNDELDEVIVKGLKRKGFEFNSMKELSEFIKERGRIEVAADSENKTYYIDEIPFLICIPNADHSFNFAVDYSTINYTIGQFSYL